MSLGVEDGRVRTLMVRRAGWRGLVSGHEWLVSVDRVREIADDLRRIVVLPANRGAVHPGLRQPL